jgi:hypothetical protein
MVTSTSSNYSNFANLRLQEIQGKIQNLESKMGIEKSTKLEIIEFKKSPCAHHTRQGDTIKLPSWFLLKYEDIPHRFRITNNDDPRLVDINFLNDFAGWINRQFQEAGITSLVRRVDYGVLQSTIKLMRDRDLFEKSKEFTLAHEMAHLNHFQGREKSFNLQNTHLVVSGAGFIGGLLLMVLAASIFPYVTIAVTLVVGGIAATVSIAAIVNMLNQSTPVLNPAAVEEEKLADMDAVEALQEAQGGVYFFETYRSHNLAIRASRQAISQIDELGNNLRDTAHPPLTERIAYLRQWEATRQRA